MDPDPDPKFPEKSDPNPDPKKIISDPQHCGPRLHGIIQTLKNLGG